MRLANCCAVSCAIKLPSFRNAIQVAGQLLGELGVSCRIANGADHAALAWRRGGMLPLSGESDSIPLMPPLPLAASADGAILALKALSDDPSKLPLNGSLLLGERARLMTLMRAGGNSTGGHCRILDAQDGRIAINLARDDDWDLVEAWLGRSATSWAEIARLVKQQNASSLVDQATELGLPVGLDKIDQGRPWITETSVSGVRTADKTPLVVDLSSLWAGPLAGNLLHLMGADVIKVESVARPDGARQGNADFYHLLNAGKRSVAVDFASEKGRDELSEIISAADIVIEASRPRALRQLGIEAEQMVENKSGKVWLRLMAYGDDQNRVGFGDDIGVSAGLCSVMDRAWGVPCFVGDAIADPISGIYAALAAWAKWQQGKNVLIELSMVDMVRHAAQISEMPGDLGHVAREWQKLAGNDINALYPMRTPSGEVEPLGTSTITVMKSIC